VCTAVADGKQRERDKTKMRSAAKCSQRHSHPVTVAPRVLTHTFCIQDKQCTTFVFFCDLAVLPPASLENNAWTLSSRHRARNRWRRSIK